MNCSDCTTERDILAQESEGNLMLQEYTMPMEVFIEPLDEDLKCIKLTNKSSELVNLGGHKLSCTTEGDH